MDEKVWIYSGKGVFLDGIPARDLTAADWARLGEDERAAVERSKLYRRAPQPKAEEPVVPAAVDSEEEQAADKPAAKQEKGKE